MSSIKDKAQAAMQSAVQTAIELAPGSWLPGGKPDPLAGRHGVIGQPLSRLDGPLKVAGCARFAAEVPLPGLLYGAIVHSAIARGRVASIDTTKARAAPGVACVMTHENAPKMKPPALFGSAPDAAGPSNLPVMQDDHVRWNGHPIAVVLADTQEQADHAKTLVEVSYHEEPALTRFDEARLNAHPPKSVLGEPASIEIGDAESALRAAEHQVDLDYKTPFYNHNAIELHAVTCVWEGDALTIHDASQLVTATARTIADVFGLAHDKVRVLSPYVGGGFGGKCLWWHQILAAAASRLAERPVRIVLSRESVYRMVGGRTTTAQRVALGARADGTLTALIHTGVAAMTTHNNCPEQFTFPARHMYAAGAIKVAQEIAEMDMIANTFMRAPGESIGTFALECAIDELAEKCGLDPIEFRRRNDPLVDPTSGHEFSGRHLIEAYRAGAEKFGWDRRDPAPRSRRDGEWLIGIGCASGTYPYFRMPGGSARITLMANGHAVIAAAAHEMGMGTATVQTQICAERLGLPVENVRFDYGDTKFPPSPVAGGSCQTASIGAAVIAAHGKLVAELLKLAGKTSPLAGLRIDEIDCVDAGLGKRGEPDVRESYATILVRAGRSELAAEAEAPPPLEMMRWSMHSTSAIFCEVRVNAVTGEIRVSRLLGSFDCGRILNPKTARSQFRGGMIMGLGLALSEETLVDPRSGRIVNASLAEYHVPVHLDVPAIDVIWTDVADPHTPMGARGIGEIGITGTGAAVANAIYNATGRRIRDLPITLDKLL
jgi:xanthine dehydrogenase YagR molybdenum-binding subunit